jgi:hypothetical protein
MNAKQSLFVILFFSVILSYGTLSCHSVKTAVACPEISIKKNDYKADRKVRNYHPIARKTHYKHPNIHRSKKIRKEEITPDLPIATAERNIEISKIEFTKGLVASIDNTFHPIVPNRPAPLLSIKSTEIRNNLTISNLQDVKCDTIVLKSGSVTIGKVEEIGQVELKYRRCNNLTGPVISLLKSDVSKILYSNGTNEFFGPTDMHIPNQTYFTNQNNFPNQTFNSAPQKTEGLGLAGFISGLVGLFIASIPLGIIAVIFGSISLSKIKRNPQRYKGKGFAIAAIILGLVDVVAMIILLGAMAG